MGLQGPLHLLSGRPLLFQDLGEGLPQLNLGLVVKLGPPNIHDVFNNQPVDGHDRYLLSGLAVNLLALEPEVEPGPRDKVHGLPDVDPGGEPCMIGPRKGQNVFSRHLQCLIDLYLLLVEIPRIDHGVDVEQDIWVLFEEEKVFLFCSLLKPFPVILWHTVPELGLAPVIIVD
jgi:hypothetical protein